MARQELVEIHLCVPYGIPATGSCHNVSPSSTYSSEKMGGSEKSAHKQKENRRNFLTTPGTYTFHEAPLFQIVLLYTFFVCARIGTARFKVSLLLKDAH